jgi:hypothetical protein
MAFPLPRSGRRRYIRWAPKRRCPRTREGVKDAYVAPSYIQWVTEWSSGHKSFPPRAGEPATRAMEHGALKPDGEGFVAAMVEDGDEIASAAMVDGAANGSCTDRGFALDDKEAEAMAGRTSFHPRILGLAIQAKHRYLVFTTIFCTPFLPQKKS